MEVRVDCGREPGDYRWSGPVRPGGAGKLERGCATASRRSGLGGPGATSYGPGELRRGDWLLCSRLAAVYGGPGGANADTVIGARSSVGRLCSRRGDRDPVERAYLQGP
ncbi:hypothetical protein NDU88_008918 [Pleurodeles waltl]|uniref:Uncharacterized protein n=1 Tax=Pleurodeles waltl TaxID=8319 RepID=A0AAV7N6F0_PLEWA|nr:hypothetical protein NDU88_008918 [Pleurodeles waltl]